jgi:hypothetical protein
MFRSLSLCLRLYIQHHTIQVLWLLAKQAATEPDAVRSMYSLRLLMMDGETV